MSNFAFIAPPFLGHLNPMLALAATLAARGHDISFFGIEDIRATITGRTCDFAPLGRRTHASGALTTMTDHMAKPGGFGLFRILADMTRMTRMLCDELPGLCRSRRIQGIVTDQFEPAGGLVAAHLGLPYVSVANALPVNREPAVPPPFTDWSFDASPRGIRRNLGGYRVADLLMRPVGSAITREARRLGVPARRSIEGCLSPFAEITQLPPTLDFPRRSLPGTVHRCGPLREPEAKEDINGLLGDGRPLVYASLGSLQGGRGAIFRRIAEACAALDLHLVIAHGGRLDAAQIAVLPGSPIVQAFVPQRSLLRHAALTISNGGLNTVLDSAAAGVPLVVIPLAFEQGAIAARVAHAGIGVAVRRRNLTRPCLEQAMLATLREPAIRTRAEDVAAALARAGGVSAAADVIEAVMRTGKPLFQTDMSEHPAPADMFEPA